MSDPMVDELKREQRERRVLVVAAVIGIVAGALCGVGYALDAFGGFARGAGGSRNPAALIFFVAPFGVCMGIGFVIYKIRGRLRN